MPTWATGFYPARFAPRGGIFSTILEEAPSRARSGLVSTVSVRMSVGLDLSRPLTSDLHISSEGKDQTEAHTPQPQNPRTSEQRNKAVSRGATWRRPDGLPLVSEEHPVFGIGRETQLSQWQLIAQNGLKH